MILDACCGGRQMWFDKHYEDAVYVDIRIEPHGTIEQQTNFHVRPNVLADFRHLPFADESFHMVVFDPPHLHHASAESIMAKKFGTISADSWDYDIWAGFSECWRVLKQNGVLIFKWSEADIRLAEVLACIPVAPLFGHTTGRAGKTKWLSFMKRDAGG